MLLTTSEVDPSLLPFLAAADALEEAAALARLNTDQIEPVIKRALGYKLRYDRPQRNGSEFEEIYNEIQLRLLKRLRALKQDPNGNQILNLRGYVATVTRNTCDEYLRHKYPLRRSLKDKVRRHLLTHADFALWEDSENNWLAGFCYWEDRYIAPHDDVTPAIDKLHEHLREKWQTVDVQCLQLNDLLRTIFEVAHAPLELDQLTGLVGEFWRIEDRPAELFDADTCVPVDQAESPATIVEQRQLLQLLWREICELPRRQRVALLLNLRNPQAINIITLLPATGIATFEEIAKVLEISAPEFEKIWVELPLDDLRVAAYLGATRQQVINLRKTARERLLKWMTALRET